MKVVERPCKSALSPSKLQGTDFALNPYKGCGHQCIYCYSRFVQNISKDDWNNIIEVKRNIPTVLAKELKNKTGIVTLSTVTDAYQPVEKKYTLTRYCLEQLVKRQIPLSILTKSRLVLRDMDLIEKAVSAEIGVTITTLDEDVRRIIEPHASPVKERIKVLDTIAARHPNVKRYAFIGPVIPHVTTTDLDYIFSLLRDVGVDYVIVDKLRLKPGMWDDIKDILSERLPRVGDVPDLEKQGYFNAVKKLVINLAEKYQIKTYVDF